MNREKLQAEIALLRHGKANAGSTATTYAKIIAQDYNRTNIHRKMNANETFTLARQLESMFVEASLEPQAKLVLSSILPVDGGRHPGEEFYRWSSQSEDGQALIGGASSARDIPLVNLSRSENRHPVVSIYGGFGLTMRDIDRSAFYNESLSTQGVLAANRMMDRALDRLLGFGDGERIATGLLNMTIGSGENELTETQGTSAHWTNAIDATAAQGMYDDLVRLAAERHSHCHGLYDATHLLLPPVAYARLQQARLSYTNVSVLELWKNSNPGVEVVLVSQLTDIDDNGGANSRGLLISARKDVVCQVITKPSEFLAPQYDGFDIRFYAEMRSAGCIVKMPVACRALTRIY
jgi:hypothetical protein